MASRAASRLALLVGLTAGAMLALGAAFYTRSVADVASDAQRHFLLAAIGAVLLPFAWIAIHLALGRIAVVHLCAIVSALAHLVGFGWFAVVLALFSWGDPTLWLPALGLPVQLVALLASILGWRKLPIEARRQASTLAAIAAPLTLAAVLAGTSAAFYASLQRLPEDRRQRQANAERAIVATQRCLIDHGRAHGGDHPAQLGEISETSEACRDAASARQRLAGHGFAYWPAPPNAAGVRAGFTACVRPLDPPDSGLVTWVADDTGALRSAGTPDHTTIATACGASWGTAPADSIRWIRHCAFEYSGRADPPGYPATLEDLFAAVPECLGPADRLRLEGQHAAVAQPFGAGGVVLRYLSDPAGPDARIAGFLVFADCIGDEGFAVVDQDAVLRNADSSRSLALLNGCRRETAGERTQLAETSGFRLPAAYRGVPAEPWLAANPEEPRFGDEPDLPVRRAECARDANACYALGRELERAVRIAGAEPDREESLNEAQLAQVRDANAAFARGCENAHAQACAAWGEILLAGRAIEPDLAGATSRLASACESGLASACARLARLSESGYRLGRAVASAIAASPFAEPRPITLHVPDESRPGIPKDVSRAIHWNQLACERGDDAACAQRARLLLESPASGEDQRREAIEQYRALCERGVAFACSKLAEIVRATGRPIAGRGASEWQRAGCVLGDTGACPSQAGAAAPRGR